jgi:hypothetical protein
LAVMLLTIATALRYRREGARRDSAGRAAELEARAVPGAVAPDGETNG